MSKRVNKPIIGKEIARTGSLVIEGASQNIVAGEVVVLDKYKKLLAAGSTIADTDVIYLAVGTGKTHDYTLPDGTAVTSKRILSYSAPIQGISVINYEGLIADSSATQQIATCDTSGITPVVGTEYVVRIVYKDINEHPGQFVQTFRYTSLDATIANLINAIVLEINQAGPSGDIDSRVTASNSTNDLVLTGRVIPNNETNDEIDEYSQVDFEVSLNSITSAGAKTNGFAGTGVAITTTYGGATPGNGNPKLVRDAEKLSLGYEGVTNTINFPVVKPTILTDMTKWYDAIIIEHDNVYESGETQYLQSTPITSEIFIPAGSGQTTDVLGVLNGWMASLPKAFDNITV